MLHAEVWSLHQLEAIGPERVRSEPVFKTAHHIARLYELSPGLIEVIVKHVVGSIECTRLTGEGFLPGCIRADVRDDIVTIDGTGHGPLIGSVAFSTIYDRSQAAISHGF